MATMGCEEFWKSSEAWMEGERRPDAASHVTGCARCRALVADLDAIRQAAANLQEVEPPARLWTSLRAQLEKEGLIRAPRAASARWWDAFVPSGVWRPALAGASLALLIAVSVSFSWRQSANLAAQNHAAWLLRAQRPIALFAADLQPPQAASHTAVSSLNADVTATLNRNLAIVDNMISLCEKSVREDPQNEMTRDYLYDAYQQKADLLAVMAQSGAEGR
jgi:hypothetical protein